MDAMEMLIRLRESPKIGVKPSSDPFLPDPEIVNIKKEQASQDPDPFVRRQIPR